MIGDETKSERSFSSHQIQQGTSSNIDEVGRANSSARPLNFDCSVRNQFPLTFNWP